MTVQRIIKMKYSFLFVQSVRDDGQQSFYRTMGRLGCHPGSMSATVKACVAAGLVKEVGRSYELTDRGFRVLADWERLLAHDGEPGEWDAPAPAVLTSKADKVARVREVLTQQGVNRHVVAPAPTPGERFVELDDDATLDPFGLGGSE